MKRFAFDMIAVLAVFALLFSGGGQALADQSITANTVAPGLVSYQGYVTVNGSPYNGTGYFKFSIINSGGSITYWSNDTNFPPVNYISLPVTNGLFNVLLGSTNTISFSVFSAPDRYLRVWFSTASGGPYTQLTPDRQMVSVPFAMQAENADKLDGLHGASYQARVGGVCEVGSTVKSIDASGNVICVPVEPRLGHTSIILDQSAAYEAAIAIGEDGLPIIAYTKAGSGLKVAACSEPTCTGSVQTTTYVPSDNPSNTSITISPEGNPMIAYWEGNTRTLKYVYCYDNTCSTANIVTVDTGDVGAYAALTVGSDGLPIIAYWDEANVDLKIAHCGNYLCNSGNVLTRLITAGISDGLYPAIAIGVDGMPIISFLNLESTNSLQVYHCGSVTCASAGRNTMMDSGKAGSYSSIAIGTDGFPVISYHDSDEGVLKVAHCQDVECYNPMPTISFLDSQDPPDGAGVLTSIAIGSDGFPVITYMDQTEDQLKLAHCSDVACNASHLQRLGDVGTTIYAGSSTGIAIGTDGMPIIIYTSYVNFSVRVIHCSNTFCTPYVRR